MSSANFTDIQTSLRNYLKNQQQFSTYNFDGAAISVWVDILSQNTAIAAANANLAFNETFLDTANQRANVVSSAKEIGYIPKSAIAPTATITLSFSVTGNPAQYVLPQGTRFSTSINGTSYTFVTTSDIIINNVSNVFTKTISIVQGILTNYSYTVNLSLPNQRLTIQSQDVDLTYLGVNWKNQNTDPSFTIVPSANSIGFGNLNSTTLAYFVQEMYDGLYDVYFGDGVLGEKLTDGNIVKLTYLITAADAANGANTFSLASSLSGISSINIVTVTPAAGGSPREDVESIRFTAPLYYQSQARAVTETDYVALLKNSLGNISDVTVWGGEKQVPPAYGNVFIAVVPHGNSVLNTSQKQNVINLFLQNYSIVGVIPQIVDPNYLSVNVTTTVRYNSRLFNANVNSNLENEVIDAITNFFNANVDKFGKDLFYSKLVAAIDNVDPVIKSNITDLTLERTQAIAPNVSDQYNFEFNNAIEPNSLTSNQIVIGGVNYLIKDIPQGSSPFTTGNIAVYNMNGNTINYLNANVGKVNYITGSVSIPALKIDDIVNDPIDKILSITVAQGSVADPNNPTNVIDDLNVYANGLEDVVILGTINVTLIPDNS